MTIDVMCGVDMFGLLPLKVDFLAVHAALRLLILRHCHDLDSGRRVTAPLPKANSASDHGFPSRIDSSQQANVWRRSKLFFIVPLPYRYGTVCIK